MASDDGLDENEDTAVMAGPSEAGVQAVADNVLPIMDDDDGLLARHRARYVDEDGEPVQKSLAVLVNRTWDQGNQKDKIKEYLEKHDRPSNILAQKVDINEEVVHSIPKPTKVRDMRMRAIQGLIA